jgi:hypothetical protein
VCEYCGDGGWGGVHLEITVEKDDPTMCRASLEMEISYILGGGFLK